MVFKKMAFVGTALVVLGLGVLGPTGAEAKACRRLCGKYVAHYREKVCSDYRGVMRRACRREVLHDILEWCAEEERTDICSSFLEG